MKTNKILYYTKSVCPDCLKTITATVMDVGGQIYMDKSCEEHGNFRTLIWQDDAEHYKLWLSYGGIHPEELPQTSEEADDLIATCSFQSEAENQACSAALMTTNRCNLNCPVCFTRVSGEEAYEPSLENCKELIRNYRDHAGENALLEFCGGEPTVRKDLPEIAAYASSIGFSYIQLNTNGIELAKSAEYCAALKESGVTTVYLGYDGVFEKPYRYKYGKSMLDIKKSAVANCREAGLAIVLVTCVVPEESGRELGGIIAYAKENMPAVKGVYFQPISYFGTYSGNELNRITIPEILRMIEDQTDGEVQIKNFLPGSYEHAQCSFNGCFLKDKNGALKSLTQFAPKTRDENGYERIRKSIMKTWMPGDAPMLTIGGMAFQDAWNIDMLRVMRCSVQIIGKNRKMYPLCSKYLTDCKGNKLNPGIS